MSDQEYNLDNILGDKAFWKVTKRITEEVGLVASAILADLISKRGYFKERNQLDSRGGFFNTADNLERDLHIKRSQRETATVKLIESGFLKKSLYGMPRRMHWYIQDKEVILCLLSASKKINSDVENLHTECVKPTSLLLKTSNDNKNKLIRIKNNNKEKQIKVYSDNYVNDIEIIKKYTTKRMKVIDKLYLKYIKAVKLFGQDHVSNAILGYSTNDFFKKGSVGEGKWNFEKLLNNETNLDMFAISGSKMKPKSNNTNKNNNDEFKKIMDARC